MDLFNKKFDNKMTRTKVCDCKSAHMEGVYCDKEGTNMKFVILENGDIEQSTIASNFEELKKRILMDESVILPFENIPNVSLVFHTIEDETIDIYIQNLNTNINVSINMIGFRDLWGLLFV